MVSWRSQIQNSTLMLMQVFCNASSRKRTQARFQISIQIGRKKLVNGASANWGITKSPLTETGDSFKDGDNCGAELQRVVCDGCWVTVPNSLRLLWWKELPRSSPTLPPARRAAPQTRRSAGPAESGCVNSYCDTHTCIRCVSYEEQFGVFCYLSVW